MLHLVHKNKEISSDFFLSYALFVTSLHEILDQMWQMFEGPLKAHF